MSTDALLRRVPVDPDVASAFAEIPNELNELGYDPWGFHPELARHTYSIARQIYRYFRPEIHGVENVPEGRVLIVGNLAGQLPFDGLVVEAQSFRAGEGWRVSFGASVAEAPGADSEGEAPDAGPEAAGEPSAAAAAADDTGPGIAGDDAEPEEKPEAVESATAAERAAAINARVAGWLYTLPDYKSDQLIKRQEDLLAAPDEE